MLNTRQSPYKWIKPETFDQKKRLIYSDLLAAVASRTSPRKKIVNVESKMVYLFGKHTFHSVVLQ